MIVNSYKIYLYASLTCAAVFGFLIANYLQPLVTNIEVKGFGTGATHEVTEIDGAYSIVYRTSGPILSYSNLGCNPLPDLLVYLPEPICLNYDGKAGIVELMIPNEVIKEFPSIDEVRVFFLRSIPFEIVRQDDLFTVIRIDLPAGYYQIELVGGHPLPLVKFIFLASGFGFIIFILAVVVFALTNKHVSALKNKRSRKWRDVVNKETRETIRRLYLNHLGAHSIAKEVDLDVGIVMDIIRGYGIQGREF